MSRVDRDRKTITTKEIRDRNPITGKVCVIPPQKIVFEHSLYSIRQWEMKWHSSWFNKKKKTYIEMVDYLYCMTVNEVDTRVYEFIVNDETIMNNLKEYMNDPKTAHRDKKVEKDPNESRKRITSETLYACMIENRIPIEHEHWHINSLIAEINVLGERQEQERNKAKKSSKKPSVSANLKNSHKSINNAWRQAHPNW